MDIKNIDYLFALEELGSVSAASKRLYIAQPTLSQFLKKYEEYLGYPIFLRTKSGLKLTSEGKLFLDTARQMIALEQEMRNRLSDISDAMSGTVVFALSSQRAPFVLPLVLPEFSRRYPNVTIKIVEGRTKDLEYRLQHGDINCGLLIPPLHNPALDYEVFMKEEILLAAPKNLSLEQHLHYRPGQIPWIDIRDLDAQTFLLHDTSNRLRDFSNELFRSYDFQPSKSMEFKNMVLLSRLASAGMGLVFLPETFIDPSYQLNYYSIGPEGAFRSLALGYPSGYRPTSVVRFSDMLKDVLLSKQHSFRENAAGQHLHGK